MALKEELTESAEDNQIKVSLLQSVVCYISNKLNMMFSKYDIVILNMVFSKVFFLLERKKQKAKII